MRRLGAILLIVAGMVMAGTGLVGTLRAAHADDSTSTLGTYSLVGDSTGVVAYEDEPSANAHPEGQGSAPESSTLLTNGPVGYGLSAVGWPGATEANAGGLVILLFPGPVGNATQSAGVPFPDAVTAAVDNNAGLANYPIRAEARTGSKPDASYSQPAVELHSHADAGNVTATAHMSGAQQPGPSSMGDTHTTSTSSLNGMIGRVNASSTVSNIDMGGVVKIGSITSTAIAQTNGVTSTGSGSIVVSDMTIGGQPAYVDQNGVHIGKQGTNPDPVANQLAQQALSGAGMTIVLSKPILETKGATTTYNSGSLIIVWAPPGDKSENVFVSSFGGSRAQVTGTVGSPFALPPLPNVPPVTPADSTPAAVVDAPVSSTPPVPQAALPATPVSRAVAPRAAVRLGRIQLAKTFGGISWAWLILGLLGVAALFAGCRRLAHDVLDRPVAACPLEGNA